MLEFLTSYGFKEQFVNNPLSEHYGMSNGEFSIGVTYNKQISRYRPTSYTIIFGDDKTTIRLNEDDISGIDWASVQNAINCETDAEVKTVLVDIIIDSGFHNSNEILWKTLAWRYRWLRTHEEMMIYSPEYRDNFNRLNFESNVAQHLGTTFNRGRDE